MSKLLLVEDNEMNRDMLVRRLIRKGYEVVCAGDGAQGVAMAQSELPDLILMDLSLPVMDGWEATRRIKASTETRRIPVIALTAHAMSGDREKALEAGCDDHDTKPIDLPRLLGKIETLLTQKPTPVATPLAPTATVVLPSTNPDPEVNPEPKSDLEPSRLLIVDDVEMNRDMLSRRLEKQGYQVSSAESGADALRMMEQTPFDLILLDIMMPGISGLEVLERLRQTHEAAALPIIMVTAKGESEDVAKALELGANDYITKPVDFVVAQARIKTQLMQLKAYRKQKQAATAIPPEDPNFLSRRYKVVRVLGSGGFSQTFLANDTQRPGQPLVVVKQLRPTQTDPRALDTARRLFNTEADTLERLGKHDQIPQLLAYFEQGHEFYLIQEFIEGKLLAEEMMGRRFSEIQVLTLLLDILGILDFIHRNGVIHRDIKPQNIIRRNSDQKLVLIDFGAVKELEGEQGQGGGRTIAIGTRGYSPLEQYAGRPRFNSDVYAIGMVAVQALTGRYPSQFQEDPATGELVWRDSFAVSARLGAVIDKMIMADCNRRYQSALDVLQDLWKIPPILLKR